MRRESNPYVLINDSGQWHNRRPLPTEHTHVRGEGSVGRSGVNVCPGHRYGERSAGTFKNSLPVSCVCSRTLDECRKGSWRKGEELQSVRPSRWTTACGPTPPSTDEVPKRTDVSGSGVSTRRDPKLDLLTRPSSSSCNDNHAGN